MFRLSRLLVLAIIASTCTFSATATSAEMTFQLLNNTNGALSLKLFSRGESRQEWPSRTRAFTIRPDSTVQSLKVTCVEEEQICWGAWTTEETGAQTTLTGQRTAQLVTYSSGVGDRGQRSCEACCHICKAGAVTPVMSMRESDVTVK
jgi:hypothetical protein